jgi:putative membrane protein
MDGDPATRRDPDARFLLANERTLLAWMRTALALEATGIALLHFAPSFDLDGAIGIGLILVGTVAGLAGYRRYRAADAAIRDNELPPRGFAPEAVAIGLFVLSLFLLGVAVGHVVG